MVSFDLGVEDLAKYSFLEEAGEYVKKRGWSIEDVSQPNLDAVVQRAKNRILQAIGRQKNSAEIDNVASAEIEILSFPAAMMLVKATNLEYLISRFSLSEALRVERFLENERKDLVIQIFRNVLKIDLIQIDGNNNSFNFRIPIMDYLTRASKFHEVEWKLINRIVNQGFVYLNTSDLIRLIRQEIDDIIRKRLRDQGVPKLPETLEKVVKEISLLSPPPRKPKTILPEKYPPCITMALGMLEKGENIPHYGRFLLTTYLVNIGKSVDEIISLYPRSPDFNERMTRYQVEHIAGLKGGRVKYGCPSCKTMITHTFCFKTEECDDITHPLQFGLKKTGSNKK